MARKVKKVAREEESWEVELMDLGSLKEHPENYRSHPEDQLGHLDESLRENGIYKNIVVARDGTILAGHGVAEAAKRVGMGKVPVRRIDVEPGSPRALKILAADNELPRFSENDDRALSEILRRIMKEDEKGLLGTGYDERNLAAFLMVTRPASEVADLNEAAEWVGMPEYDEGMDPIKLIVTFQDAAARVEFVQKVGLKFLSKPDGKLKAWSARWPNEEPEDASSLRFGSKG